MVWAVDVVEPCTFQPAMRLPWSLRRWPGHTTAAAAAAAATRSDELSNARATKIITTTRTSWWWDALCIVTTQRRVNVKLVCAVEITTQ